MDDLTRTAIAESLENLANEQTWNSVVWQKCYELITANLSEDDLVQYVVDDLIHYNGKFHSRNILGFRVKPHRGIVEEYRQEFRDVATSLRLRMSLKEAQEKYGF